MFVLCYTSPMIFVTLFSTLSIKIRDFKDYFYFYSDTLHESKDGNLFIERAEIILCSLCNYYEYCKCLNSFRTTVAKPFTYSNIFFRRKFNVS